MAWSSAFTVKRAPLETKNGAGWRRCSCADPSASPFRTCCKAHKKDCTGPFPHAEQDMNTCKAWAEYALLRFMSMLLSLEARKACGLPHLMSFPTSGPMPCLVAAPKPCLIGARHLIRQKRSPGTCSRELPLPQTWSSSPALTRLALSLSWQGYCRVLQEASTDRMVPERASPYWCWDVHQCSLSRARPRQRVPAPRAPRH